jgi:5'-3' exonuclease
MHYILIDGTNIAWQVYHSAKVSMPNFDTIPADKAKEVIYGMLNVLAPALNPSKKGSLGALHPNEESKIIVALDSGPTWRLDVDPSYKNGKASPTWAEQEKGGSRFGTQIAKLPAQLAGFGVQCVHVDSLEGDDILGLMATNLLKTPGNHVSLISKDKDTLSLVQANCAYYNQALKEVVTPSNFEAYTAKAFKLSKGLKPEELPTFRGLSGDDGDNIMGVPGCANGYANMIIQALRPSGDLKGYQQDPEEIVAILRKHAPSLPKPLQQLLTEPNLGHFKNSFVLASPLQAPAELQTKLRETLAAAPELPKPTKAQLQKALDDLNFSHFSKQLQSGWGNAFTARNTQPELPGL